MDTVHATNFLRGIFCVIDSSGRKDLTPELKPIRTILPASVHRFFNLSFVSILSKSQYQLLMIAQTDSFNKEHRITCFLILPSRLLLEELASGLHSKFDYSTVSY